MSGGHDYRPTLIEQVEQMIARGRSFDYILEHLPITEADVDAALERMDAACIDKRRKPRAEQPCGTPERYKAHLTAGEDPDEACRRAEAMRRRTYRQRVSA